MTAYARPLSRTSMPATYSTDTIAPNVFFTALSEDGVVLVERTQAGITLTDTGLYEYIVPVDATTDTFVARWDEGDPDTYSEELIVVPRGDRGPAGIDGGAVASVAGKTGVVTLVEADVASLVADLAAKAPKASPTFTGTTTAPEYTATGLSGATAASRYVGATTSGAPASGAFLAGDFVVDQSGSLWICTTAGSPGTWAIPGGGSGSGPQTVKASYLGTPASTVFYTSYDLSGNVIQARTPVGVVESPTIPGLYFYDQVVSIDQFVASWDEDDGLEVATELIATRHPVRAPSPPTSITAVGGDTQATITFTPGDNGGSAVTSYTVTATDTTNGAHGGQVQSGLASGITVTGLTNGESYKFAVTATTSFGTSVASGFSNSVVPAVVLRAPDAPTGVSAAVSGSGQVTVTFTAPANNGGASITSYLVTAVDETNSAHNTTHAGASPNVLTGLVNGEVYHFTAHAVNSVGAGAESVASNSVTPSGSGGVATFTYTQPTSTMVLLDATGSSGTLAWEIDSVASTLTTTTLLVGPLKVGSHHVKLTATSGGAGITERDIDVAWVARPLALAQHDPTNGPTIADPGYWGVPAKTHSATELPQFASQPTLGPWRNYVALNMVEGYPGAGDGVERIHAYDDNHISVLCKYADHPTGLVGGGGYRNSLEYANSYMQNQDWSSATTYASGKQVRYLGAIYTSLQNANTNKNPASQPTWWELYSEFAVMHSLDLSGQNISNSNTIDGHSTEVRFYRIGMMIPTGNPAPLLYQNNLFQLYGVSDGAILFSPDGAGQQIGWQGRSKVNGVQGSGAAGIHNFDWANIQHDTWYDYVVEVCFNVDPAIGYMRVYRDLGAGMVVLALSRCPTGTVSTPGANYGKFFYATQQTDKSGVPSIASVDIQNYRDRANLDAYYTAHGVPYGDVTIEYRNCLVGPTLASVMI